MVLVLVLNAALILVLPSIALVCGTHRYATESDGTRTLKDLFRPMMETPRHILWLTVFFLVVLSASYVNLFVLSQTGVLFGIVRILNYILLGVAALVFVHAPAVLHRMDVTPNQLFHNAVMMALASPLTTIPRLGLLGLLIYAAIHALPLFVFGFPIAILLIARSSNHTLLQLKEKMK
jgi:hypothetical protein